MTAHARGQFREAHELVSRAIELKPAEPVFLANHGAVLEALGRFTDAEEVYRQALRLNPRDATALNNLGNLHRAAWRLEEAAECYRAAIEQKPDFVNAHNNQGVIFADRRQFDQAIECYRRALEIDGSFFDARKNLAYVLSAQGRYREGKAELARAAELRPSDASLKIRSALLLPVIPESVDAIDERRREMEADLDRLLDEELHILDPIADTLGPAFHLAFHGRHDLPLQRKIAAVYERAVPSLKFTAPHCVSRGTRPHGESGPIRVGLISRFFQQHSIGDHYAGLLRAFPREGVHYTICRFPGPEDAVSREMEEAADDVLTLSPRLGEAREQLAAREFDVLFYTDIGMDPWTYFLAFARLAPVQCVTLGHPVTTGIPTLDAMLSCDLQEPPDAETHYSERLVRTQNMPHYFARPVLTGAMRRRGDYPLPDEARWYVCHQTLFKIHPEFDRLLGEILRRDPRGVVILFSDGQAPQWKTLMLERMQRSISDVAGRVTFLPRLPREDYLNFLTLADVLLDTVHFGGSTTMYHALALGVPLVTLPGRFARSRETLTAYLRIGVSDCIASDASDYVRRAVMIANDRALRESIGAACRERSGALFSNGAAAREIEEFFIDAVRRHRASRR